MARDRVRLCSSSGSFSVIGWIKGRECLSISYTAHDEAQVAAVAGVNGVLVTAGVRGGCSAIFSRKAARLSTRGSSDGT